jgi:hypothetical protein
VVVVSGAVVVVVEVVVLLLVSTIQMEVRPLELVPPSPLLKYKLIIEKCVHNIHLFKKYGYI